MEAANLGDNSDVLYEILLRLPVKTLKRFECVCKSWFSLISSPQFQLDHFRRAQQNPLILTLQSEESIFVEPILDDKLTLRFSAYEEEGFDLVNKFSKRTKCRYFDTSMGGKPFMISCLGLVCISSWSFSGPPILICNPSTQELISLPPAEHPSRCVGFGYAASTQEFKVVRFFYDGKKGRCQVSTLGTSRWREARNPPYRVGTGSAPFLHGALHFLPHVTCDGVQDTDFLAVFDIETEEYREGIPLPEYYHSLGDWEGRREGRDISLNANFIRLTKLRGSLCLTFDYGELGERLELWLLKDYNNAEWVKGYTINVSSVYPFPRFNFWAYLTDTMGDERILLNCFDENGVKLLSYDPQSEAVTLEKDKEWGATFYVESFYRLLSR